MNIATALARDEPLLDQPSLWVRAIETMFTPDFIHDALTRVGDMLCNGPSGEYAIVGAFRRTMTRRQREDLRLRVAAFTLMAVPSFTPSKRETWTRSMQTDHRRLVKFMTGVVTGVIIAALGFVALVTNSAKANLVEIDVVVSLIGTLMVLYSFGEYRFQRWVFRREKALHDALDMILAGKPVPQVFNDDGTLRSER